ncbi:putative RNA-binding protein 15B [Gallus gallus]|uniref:putative RNA-binding protein 15B n=1 Tax=Gallus gallus TaxID=9031 RepID=UPI001F00B51A|nr:putative RNA-binding protein 15B [Gallus gallus]XP_046794980.1 putative RNA-binding protein 15B [Gallus gallus]
MAVPPPREAGGGGGGREGGRRAGGASCGAGLRGRSPSVPPRLRPAAPRPPSPARGPAPSSRSVPERRRLAVRVRVQSLKLRKAFLSEISCGCERGADLRIPPPCKSQNWVKPDHKPLTQKD